jgi:4-diphosphocytidyl-2C-methyl-D-erythritol 2-phosphate synthase
MIQDKQIIFAPAKLNVFLKVINKREDGYHNIRSCITFINLYDKIEITRSTNTNINYKGPF